MKYIIILMISIMFLAACTQNENMSESITQVQQETNDIPDNQNWDELIFSDIDGNTINLKEYDVPVLVESFAVWCPTCLSQQKEVSKAHDLLGDSFVSIALNIDPNEDENLVRQYRDQHELGLIYAVAPVELTRKLIDEFGNGIVQAPQTPIILYCNGEGRMLPSGIRSAEQLSEDIMGCL